MSASYSGLRPTTSTAYRPIPKATACRYVSAAIAAWIELAKPAERERSLYPA
jgi:hypothetical protein